MAQLFYKYGAMNSGKSIEILKVAHNYEEQNKPVLIFTPAIDTRDEVGYISSRIGLKRKATAVYDETNLYELVKEHVANTILRLNRRSTVFEKRTCITVNPNSRRTKYSCNGIRLKK